MVHCYFCGKQVDLISPDGILKCCGECGRVIESDCYSSEPTFIKTAAGQSQLGGNFVRSVQNAFSASRERIFNRARMDIDYMMNALDLSGGDSIINQAMCFYTIAYERNFTKGRRVEQVEASCLYIACRENKKPYLLIDFSEYLKVNVYVLGAVFLQLCKLLSLQEHPIVQKPVDPSLFIHRFSRGIQGADNAVTKTALRIIASMKRDWMQTGRKPSGLCGAALYISALSYGLQCSKSDIMKIVHVCEATLTKRLIEFENTESGSLTIEEFNVKADELESFSSQPTDIFSKESGIRELLCVHKDSGKRPSPFAHGLCESCYDDFIILSGGLDGGSEPPAFQHAEEERIAKAAAEENAKKSNFKIVSCQNRVNELRDKSLEIEFDNPSVSGSETLQYQEPENTGVGDPEGDDFPQDESLSDIDDTEVEGYLHNEEEKRYKKIIWEKMNREYLEEQAAKEAAAAAAKEAFEANFRGRPEELKAAQELAEAAAAAVAKSRKERQQKRAMEAKNSGPAQTAAEATRQMLNKKRPSSRINYRVLDNLFEENEEDPENPKKARAESPLKDEDGMQHDTVKVVEPERSGGNEYEQGKADEYEDDTYGGGGEYGNDYYDEAAVDGHDNYGDDGY